MDYQKVKEFFIGIVVIDMKVILEMIKKKEKELNIIMMVIHFKDVLVFY